MPEGLDVEEMDKSVGFKVARLALRMKKELRRAFLDAGMDVTPEQWAVMNRLYHADGLPQCALAAKASKDGPTITRILDTLEKRGLVVRGRDHSDKRCHRVHLTMAGGDMCRRLLPLVRGMSDRLVKGLDMEEVVTLRTSLDHLLNNLE